MTDKQIIKEKGNQKCIFYNDDICRKGDKTRDCLNCARVEYHSLYKLNWENQERLESQLEAKEQECEGLKEEIKNHNDDMFKNPPEKRFYCKGCTLPYISKKLKQTLTEIKEIAERDKEFCIKCNGNKEIDCVDCIEGGRALLAKEILQKISECEGE